MHETLADLAYRHAIQSEGASIPRVSLHVAHNEGWPIGVLYQPMFGIVLRGTKRVVTDRNWNILDTVRDVADKISCSPAHVALAWAGLRNEINSVLIGASRPEQVHENIAAESFFSSMKTERIGRKIYRTRNHAKADVFDHIELLQFDPPTLDAGLSQPHGLRGRRR